MAGWWSGKDAEVSYQLMGVVDRVESLDGVGDGPGLPLRYDAAGKSVELGGDGFGVEGIGGRAEWAGDLTRVCCSRACGEVW